MPHQGCGWWSKAAVNFNERPQARGPHVVRQKVKILIEAESEAEETPRLIKVSPRPFLSRW
jgi:hypothetical protein